jgi:hypothetical protein
VVLIYCSLNICGVFVCNYLVLNNWHQSTFLGKNCGQYFFLFLQIFSEKKKRVATFRIIYVYLYEKIEEMGCIYEFLS